jgi:predicted house-cleaning noncanonical NTP pyrophosphatase (MazG superfamily)
VGKLVRDLIPQIIESEGRTPSTRVLDDVGYERALLDKVVEEARELRYAPDGERLEEMADVYEVLRAVAELRGHTMDDVVARADDKRAERGGFSARIWLSSW